MTLKWIDSFDCYSTSELANRYSSLSSNPAILQYAGRNSTYGLKGSTNSQGAGMAKVLDSRQTWIVGGAWYIANVQNSDMPIIELADLGINIQCGLYIVANTGQLRVKRDVTTTLETSVSSLTTSTYPYIEFKCTIGNSGSWEVRVNGDVWCQGTGDTQASPNASANEIILRCGTESGAFDDLYILDTNGSSNNDFLGDVRVEAVFPNGAGNYTQWAALSGINWQAVGERTPDSDTTYNYSSTSGNIDTFAFGNLTSASGTVYGVQVNMFARKDDATNRRLKSFVREDGVDAPGSGIFSLTTSYTYYTEMLEINPVTSGNWTIADINNSEFGYKNVS